MVTASSHLWSVPVIQAGRANFATSHASSTVAATEGMALVMFVSACSIDLFSCSEWVLFAAR